MDSTANARGPDADSSRWSKRGRAAALSILCAIAFLAAATNGVGHAAQRKPDSPAFNEWSRDLDWVERVLTAGTLTGNDLTILQDRIEHVRNGLTDVRTTAARNLAEQRALLEALGPPPGEEAPAESPDIVRQRRVIERAIAKWDGWHKKSELLSQRSRELLRRLASAAREIKADALTTREVSPLRWTVLRRISREAKVTWQAITNEMPAVARDAASAGLSLLVTSLGVSLLALAVIAYFKRRASARLRRIRPNARARRRLNHLAILGRLVADGLLPAVAIIAPGATALYWMPTSGLLTDVSTAFGVCAALLLISVAAMKATFIEPGMMRRALMPDAARAGRTVRLASAVSACALASLWLKLVADPLKLGDDLYFLAAFPLRLMAAATFLFLIGTRLQRLRLRRQAVARIVAGLSFTVLALNPLLIGLGYGPLADWLFFGLSGTFAALWVLRLLQGASREALALFRNRTIRSKARRQNAADANDAGGSVLQAFAFGLVQVALWAATGGFLLFAWGVRSVQAQDWLDAVMTGVTIGNVRIAPLDIILAFAVFALGLALSRLAQHAFDRRVLRRARVDAGTRNALRTCAGYTGITVATLAAILTLGIDLSNLALIAGALSVGVGFGMQTIVNNFVSGIILLIERPIKTGDWVVVGDCEGIVKQVRVRATEIETFQRSSVLVPNSKIISEAVVNWTFNDLTGRVDISVGVDSASDPERVARIMTQAAHDHPSVLEMPPPHAYLSSLTHGAINFQLWAYIDVRDSRNKFRVESALLFQIMKEFQRVGIRLAQPFPAGAIDAAGHATQHDASAAAQLHANPA